MNNTSEKKCQLRILHFYRTYLPNSIGGVEQMIYQLCSSSPQYGIKPEVLSLIKSPEKAPSTINNHNVYWCRKDFEFASNSFSWGAFTKFRYLAAKADIVHYHFPWPFSDLVHFLSGIQKPTVLTYHSDIVRQKMLLHLYRPLMRQFLGHIDRIVATSPNYLTTSSILQEYNIKVAVIPIGLDRESYPVPTAELLDHWRRHLGPRFFLFIGVLRFYKGLHILLDALVNTKYPTVIIGAGPIEKALKKHANKLHLDNVHFLGYLPDVDKVALLTLAYSVVFPSHLRSEAFGITLLEGAMYGKPLISSEIGTGTSFVNIDGDTGLVILPGDPAALEKAMCWLWQNPKQAQLMGKRAQQRFYKHFTANQMASNYSELYYQLIEEKERVNFTTPLFHV